MAMPACILGTRFHPFLLSGRRPLSFSAYHFQPSPSLISFLLLLLPGIEQRSRISPPKKEGGGEGGKVISGPSPSSPLLPLLPSCLPGRRWCPAVVWTTTVSARRGEGTGNGEDDQSIFVVVITSGLALLCLSLYLLLRQFREERGKTKVKAREEMEKMSDSSSFFRLE